MHVVINSGSFLLMSLVSLMCRAVGRRPRRVEKKGLFPFPTADKSSKTTLVLNYCQEPDSPHIGHGVGPEGQQHCPGPGLSYPACLYLPLLWIQHEAVWGGASTTMDTDFMRHCLEYSWPTAKIFVTVTISIMSVITMDPQCGEDNLKASLMLMKIRTVNFRVVIWVQIQCFLNLSSSKQTPGQGTDN